METEVSCLRRRLAEGGGAAGKNLSASGLCYVCVPGEEGYYGLGVCASGEVGSVCRREGQERRERKREKYG